MTNEQLVIRICAGIDEADNTLQLWQQNRGYINKIVNHYKAYAEEEDLQQEAYLGLCEAIRHYNPEEEVPFITYAGYWIRQQIGRYIKSNGTVRLPEHIQARVKEYKQMVLKWKGTIGRKPTDREICHYLGISMEMLENIRKTAKMARIVSLDVPVGEDGECSMYDLLPSAINEEEQVLEKIQQEELKEALWSLVDSLPGEQPKIIRLRYQNGMTLRAIAEDKGVTLNAVSQQERNGLRELRKPSKSNQLRPFLYDEDRVYSRALKGNGVNTFNLTWTSSTERVAILEEEKGRYESEMARLRESIQKAQ